MQTRGAHPLVLTVALVTVVLSAVALASQESTRASASLRTTAAARLGASAGAQPLLAKRQRAKNRLRKARQYRLVVAGDELLLVTDRGEEVLRFPARLDFKADRRQQSLAGTWEERGPQRAIARARNDVAEVLFEVTASPHSATINARVEVTYLRDTFIDHEVWSLPLLDLKGRVLDRAYQWHNVGKEEIIIDRWTPLLGQFHAADGPGFALVGDDNFQTARVGKHAIHLELDHWANHPHTVYKRCHASYAPHRAELGQSRRARQKGERVKKHLAIVVGRGRMPILRRWPDDREAAFAFVDHADNGRTKTLRALLYGDSTGKDPERGLFGNGLVLTRTAFDHPKQMGDEEFRTLLQELTKRGGEVAPHSITPWRESVAQVEKSLATTFAPFAPRTWVDHQPDTNCEAINNLGGRRGHKKNMVATLMDQGIRYLWEAPDPDYDGDLNLLQPGKKTARSPFLYQAPRIGSGRQQRDPWLFSTAWMFVPAAELATRLGKEPLDRLERQHGVHLAHTYLGAIHRSEANRANTIFKRTRGGGLSTRADVEAAWTRLGKRSKRGTLWVSTVGDIGDWLTTWDRVRLKAESPTRVRLVHEGGDRFVEDGFTVAARYRGRIGGKHRQVMKIGQSMKVWPPIFEADLGVTFVHGARYERTALSRGYAWPRTSGHLFEVARALGAPGVSVEEPCSFVLPGGECGARALEPFYERLDGLISLGEKPAQRTRILVFGNSLIASDRVTDVVRKRLQRRFGDGGRGIVYVDALKYFGRRSWTGLASGGWYAEYLTQYLGARPPAAYPLGVTGGHFVAYNAGASTVWQLGGAREAELLWLDHARAPPFSLVVDGETLLKVKPTHSGRAAISQIDLPKGARTLTFVSAGPRAVVYGATLEQPEPGVVLDTIGIVAASANSYLKADAQVFVDQLKMRNPALVIFMLGGNEARRIDRGVFSKQEVEQDFSRLLARVRQALPEAACLTVGPIETVFVHTPKNKPFQTRPYLEYVVAIERERSLQAGCGFLDLFGAMGGRGSLTRFDRQGFLHGDRIHPRGDGLDMLGELVADALLRAYAKSGPERSAALATLPGAHDALLNDRDPNFVTQGAEPKATRLPLANGERSAP